MVSSCKKLLRSEEFWFCRGCSTSLMSTMGARVIAGERGGRERRHAVFFIPWTMVSCRRSEKFITKQGGNTLKTLFTRFTLGGCKRRQSVLETKSLAVISNSTVLLDCHERVISQRWKLIFASDQQSHARLTPRLLLRKYLAYEKLHRDRHEGDHNNVKGVAGHCREHNVVKEDDSFQVDLRFHRLWQDRMYKDE